MDATRKPNPYRPGFNQAPAVLAGRDEVLDGAAEALQVAALDARTPRPLVLVGPRGLGKTVTLAQIAALAAERHSWPSVHVEAAARMSLLGDLVDLVRDAGTALSGRHPERLRRQRSRISGGKLGASAFGVGAEVELSAAPPTNGEPRLLDVLADTMQIAVRREAGLLVTLDELQNAQPGELGTLAAILQQSVPNNWPLVVAIAALPSLRRTKGPNALPTYLERAEWHELAELTASDAREALTKPADLAGRPMTAPAGDVLLAVAGGYPYAIQVAGHYAWRASHGSARITLEHARAAVPRIESDLAQLYAGRWADASRREREYLQALAEVSRTVAQPAGGDVARRLGRDVREVSYLRDRLLKAGTVYQDESGALRFITPGMEAWILQQT